MAVTGSITTRFIDEKGLDLGKTLIEKDYLISVYPNIVNQLNTPMLMGWGFNTNATLGDNSTAHKSSPIQTIAYGNNWKQSSCGNGHSSGIKSDGTLWCWGVNTSGRLGDNTATNKSSPVQTVTFATNWKQVACSQSHTAAIKTDGTLWCWGANALGQLGDNTVTARSSPVQTVTFATNWKIVACGNTTMGSIKTDGTLWIWGSNASGQIGDNSISSRSSPVQTIALGTNWLQIAFGNAHTAAIKNDGTLWCWGLGTSGQLGDNAAVTRSSPVQTVAFGTTWKQVSCGTNSTYAIKTDGTLWCWGDNATYGMLGDNTTTARSSPVQTITYGTNWKQVSGLSSATAALKTDGTLWTWGYNAFGLLGDNTNTNRSSPVQTVIYGNTWKSVGNNCGVSPFLFAIKDGDF